MKILKELVRKLSAWAWQEEIGVTKGVAVIEELHATPGKMEVAIHRKPELARYMAQCFAELVSASPNYTEMKFDIVGDSNYGWITVIVQKGNGRTPHQLRQEAELERDALKKLLGRS